MIAEGHSRRRYRARPRQYPLAGLSVRVSLSAGPELETPSNPNPHEWPVRAKADAMQTHGHPASQSLTSPAPAMRRGGCVATCTCELIRQELQQ
jgi:hypothetical protein